MWRSNFSRRLRHVREARCLFGSFFLCCRTLGERFGVVEGHHDPDLLRGNRSGRPYLRHHGTSWWSIFHLLLILPLALTLVIALVGAALDLGSVSWKSLRQRLRLSAPTGTAWLWAAALSGFMFGEN